MGRRVQSMVRINVFLFFCATFAVWSLCQARRRNRQQYMRYLAERQLLNILFVVHYEWIGPRRRKSNFERNMKEDCDSARLLSSRVLQSESCLQTVEWWAWRVCNTQIALQLVWRLLALCAGLKGSLCGSASRSIWSLSWGEWRERHANLASKHFFTSMPSRIQYLSRRTPPSFDCQSIKKSTISSSVSFLMIPEMWSHQKIIIFLVCVPFY